MRRVKIVETAVAGGAEFTLDDRDQVVGVERLPELDQPEDDRVYYRVRILVTR